MIYVVISGGTIRKNELINKRDCRVLRQPQSLLPDEVKKYIENTANEKTKDERNLAYISLFSALKVFYSLDRCTLERSKNGKPYISTSLPSPIFFSLSHSDGMTAVALTDENNIGVDIQGAVDEEKAKRLENRFLSQVTAENSNFEINYYYLTFNDDLVTLETIEPKKDNNSDFLSKWVFAEANIKCLGLTFSDISKINEISKFTKTQTISFENFKIATTIAK